MSVNLAAIANKSWPYVRGYLTRELKLGDRLDSRSDAFALGYLGRATGINIRHLIRFDKECGASFIPDDHTCHISGGRSPKANQAERIAIKSITDPLEVRSAANKYGDNFVKHLIIEKFGFDEDDISDTEDRLKDSLFRHGVDQIDGKAAGMGLAQSLGIQSDLDKIQSGRQKRGAKAKSVTDGVDAPEIAATKYLDSFFKGMTKRDREDFTVSLAEDRKKYRGNFGKEYLRGMVLGEVDENSDDPVTGFISASIDQMDSQKLNDYFLGQRQVNSTASKRRRKT